MAGVGSRPSVLHVRLPLGVVVSFAASLMLGGCAQVTGGGGTDLLSSLLPNDTAATEEVSPQDASKSIAQQYLQNPSSLEKALAYAQHLKGLGEKRQALAVLQQASQAHSTDPRLASEYGRLALELDQVSVAKKMLEVADDPAAPDWRVVLARGTVLAKEGSYREALVFYERARTLAPDQPSVMSNLALAYAMNGEAAKGETLLRKAVASGDASPKVRQNLALVLGLQGKYDEATRVATLDGAPDVARHNADVLRKITKLENVKQGAPSEVVEDVAKDAWSTDVVIEAPVVSVKAPQDNATPVVTTVLTTLGTPQ